MNKTAKKIEEMIFKAIRYICAEHSQISTP